MREKDVTLAIARRLAGHLRQAGFEVVMTRDDDRYVALEERTAIANARRGDLFVSIHANANPRRALAGSRDLDPQRGRQPLRPAAWRPARTAWRTAGEGGAGDPRS